MSGPHRRDGWRRWVYIGLGLVSLAIGTAGLLLPLMPGTPFVVLAAYFFARSSHRFHAWLPNNRLFGPIIEDWHDHRGMTRGTKVRALGVLWGGILVTGTFLIDQAWLRVTLVGVGALVSAIILRVRTVPSRRARDLAGADPPERPSPRPQD